MGIVFSLSLGPRWGRNLSEFESHISSRFAVKGKEALAARGIPPATGRKGRTTIELLLFISFYFVCATTDNKYFAPSSRLATCRRGLAPAGTRPARTSRFLIPRGRVILRRLSLPRLLRSIAMEWTTPTHEEIDLSCEISSYANAEL
jgi:hypothetical protein